MHILIVDDDLQQAENLALTIESFGHRPVFHTDPKKGLEEFERENFDLTLLDMKMPLMDGLTFLKYAIETRPDARIVILTAYGTIDTAVEAMKRGAFDFMVKPIEKMKLKTIINLVDEALRFSVMANLSAPQARDDEPFIALDPVMRRVKDLIRKVASLATAVFISGETGTGKELVARAIHANSPRKDKPFIAVNCANLQENLLESELFGHEKGAFTGAGNRKLGKFEIASGGTLFLDEVGEFPWELQAKLLRVLQEQEIERVGGTRSVRVDVRLVSATNRNLAEMVEQGKFRKDLYYRLNVFPLSLPPLRERPDDLPLLAKHFISELAAAHSRPAIRISDEAFNWLRAQQWPGNIRELKNVLERAVIIDDDNLVTIADLSEDQGIPVGHAGCGNSFNGKIEESEREILTNALKRTSGNVVAAARELGLPRRTMYDRLKKLGMEPSAFRKS